VDDERAERIGRNEAVFREVNERIEDVAETLDFRFESLEFICECGNPDCTDRFTMTRSEYAALRSDALLFALTPGHEIPDVEDVVEKRDGYDVVRKRPGTPAAVAAEAERRED
jgi:hypothetical protein